MHPDTARELKARILERLPAAAAAARRTRRRDAVAVGRGRADPGRAAGARGRAAASARPTGRCCPTWAAAAAAERRRPGHRPGAGALLPRARRSCGDAVRPLRPGLSVAHPSVTAGTLGGFVRTGGGLAILSNNHVLAASDAAALGDAVLQPGPADGGAHGRPGGDAARVPALPADGCPTWWTPPSPSSTPASPPSPATCPAAR